MAEPSERHNAASAPPTGAGINPFVTPLDAFYEGGNRRSCLEQLRHLSQWSRRVLLVTGPRNVGKSVLFRELSRTLEPRAKAARINATLVNGRREVLAAIAQGYGLAVPGDAGTQLLADVIAAHVDEQQAADRFCVVLIDDAELLDGQALVQLLQLAGRCAIRMVLFAEIGVVSGVDRAAGALNVGWHEMRLAGFDPAEVRAYLEWRFRQVNYRGRVPFTDQQIRDIARLSEGLPGRINQMANVLMARLQSGELVRERGRFPAVHRALVVVLVLLIGIAWLLLQPGEPDPLETEVVALSVPTPEDTGAEEGAGQAADQARRTALDEVAGPAAGTAQEALPAGEESAEADGMADVRERPAGSGVVQPTEAQVHAQAGADASAGGQQPVAAAPPAAEVAAPENDAVEPRAADEKSSAEGAPEVTATGGAAAPPAAPAPPAGALGTDWILAQPAAAYTLQLVTLSTAERAAAFVARQPDPARFAVYQLQRDGRILHVVIYGSFADRAAAEQASRTLPATVGRITPWIRTFAQVQDAARTLQRQ
ncbi:MAG: AAA family ATPase [Pseudomonadales bacterium]